MKKQTVKQALALFLASAMMLCAVSCEGDSAEMAESSPEMAYPLLSEKYFSASGEPEGEDLYTYDEDGHLINCEYRLAGESKETYAYKYENGRLVRKTERHTCAECEQADEIVYDYQYDASGRLTEISKTVNKTYKGKVSYMRGGSGRIKRVIYYDADNGFQGMVEHKYDASGNCIEEKEYDARSMISRHIYQYDESGRVSECMVYDNQGFACTYRFAYGNSGELLRKSWVDENGITYRAEQIEYDASGKKKSLTVTDNGKTEKMTLYEAYDDNGNCIKEAVYNENQDSLGWREYTYGAEKMPIPAWEFSEHTFHGDFLVQSGLSSIFLRE